MKTQSLYPSPPVSRITHHGSRYFALRTSHFALRAAFTLIEMLVVIAVISVIAGMIFPVIGVVNKNKMRSKAKAELNQVQHAIEDYKTKLGHYPPDNPGLPRTNQLYYELIGTLSLNDAQGSLKTLDDRSQIGTNALKIAFGPNVSGIVNCTAGSGSDEARVATKFLTDLKPGQFANYNGALILVSSSPWPDANTAPLPLARTLNPICYNSSSPTNNPNSFDLWIDLVIGGKTNRVNNWSSQPIFLN
jgi:prepilin-type N-terminal cleavage/methylation domain-containing protein